MKRSKLSPAQTHRAELMPGEVENWREGNNLLPIVHALLLELCKVWDRTAQLRKEAAGLWVNPETLDEFLGYLRGVLKGWMTPAIQQTLEGFHA